MAYQIKAYYVTGDSFHSEDTSTELPPIWNDLNQAKEALKVLTAHHKAYYEVEKRWDRQPVDYDAIMSAYWYTGKCLKTHNAKNHSDWHYSAFVPNDAGEKIQIHVPYHGYFERLKRLEIEALEPDVSDMSVTF